MSLEFDLVLCQWDYRIGVSCNTINKLLYQKIVFRSCLCLALFKFHVVA